MEGHVAPHGLDFVVGSAVLPSIARISQSAQNQTGLVVTGSPFVSVYAYAQRLLSAARLELFPVAFWLKHRVMRFPACHQQRQSDTTSVALYRVLPSARTVSGSRALPEATADEPDTTIRSFASLLAVVIEAAQAVINKNGYLDSACRSPAL